MPGCVKAITYSEYQFADDVVLCPPLPRRLPYTFVTKEVLEATCECLLEQAKKAEQTHQPQVEAERMILEEFGHCLMRIINSAGKAKADCASINC